MRSRLQSLQHRVPNNTKNSNVVTNTKTNESIKQYANQTKSSNTKKVSLNSRLDYFKYLNDFIIILKSTSMQLQSITNSDVMNLNQMQSQINYS